MSSTLTCPPWLLNNSSLRTPARATHSPSSTHSRITVSGDSVSVPAKRWCSGLRPTAWVGRNSAGNVAGRRAMLLDGGHWQHRHHLGRLAAGLQVGKITGTQVGPEARWKDHLRILERVE